MLVGALADAGADTALITGAIASLQCDATVSFDKTVRGGVSATKYKVATRESKTHRHLSHIVKMIEGAKITARSKETAIAIFQCLGEAEATVHNVPIEKVHFHEVGAADSIADIVGAAVAFDSLDVSAVVCSPINVGSGTVQTEHGLLPVPAPATARLLMGKPIYVQGPAVELATPTGAAIAVTMASRFGVLPALKLESIGYGAGDRDFPNQANVLRVFLGQPLAVSESLIVSVLEANIDDLTPQVLAYATERLLESGALDVTLQPLVMKRGRPGQLVRVIARPEHQEALAQILFAETSTLGVRIHTAERRVQTRTTTEVDTPYGKVHMKVSGGGGFAPEYEDCRRLARQSGVALKHIIAEANFAYLNKRK